MKTIHVVSVNSYDKDYGRKYFVTIHCDTLLRKEDKLIFNSAAFMLKLGDDIVYSHPIFVIEDIKKIRADGRMPKKCSKAKKGDKIIATVVSDVPSFIEVGADVYKLTYTSDESASHTYTHVYTPPLYDVDPDNYKHKDWADVKAMKDYRNRHGTTNEYKGTAFSTNEKRNVDHVSPLHTQVKAFSKSKKARVIPNDRKKEILNGDYNFAVTDEHTNKSKGAKSNADFVKTNGLEGTKQGKKMISKQQSSEKSIKAKTNKAYAKEAAKDIGINWGTNVIVDGVIQTVHQIHDVKNGKPVKQAVKDGVKKLGENAIIDLGCAICMHIINLYSDSI